VPAVVWGGGVAACGPARMHERAVAGRNVVAPEALLAGVAELV
jgi:hypothetical protein